MKVYVVVKQIRTFMQAKGYNESRLAKEAGVPQPTLHRALKNPARLTKTHRAVCKFAGIDLTLHSRDPNTKDELIQEVLDIWDGSREHAHSLARLLRAAASLQAYGASQGGPPR